MTVEVTTLEEDSFEYKCGCGFEAIRYVWLNPWLCPWCLEMHDVGDEPAPAGETLTTERGRFRFFAREAKP